MLPFASTNAAWPKQRLMLWHDTRHEDTRLQGCSDERYAQIQKRKGLVQQVMQRWRDAKQKVVKAYRDAALKAYRDAGRYRKLLTTTDEARKHQISNATGL